MQKNLEEVLHYDLCVIDCDFDVNICSCYFCTHALFLLVNTAVFK